MQDQNSVEEAAVLDNENSENDSENHPEQETVVKTDAEEVENSDDPEQIEEKDSKFTPGQELTFIRVRFPGNAKSFPFMVGKRRFSYGQKVLAMSDRGMDVGYINSFPYTVRFNKGMLPIRTVKKAASDEDIREQQSNIDLEKEAKSKCEEVIGELNLDMNITHVEIIQFGKKMVFYFTAPARVDFRELVKRLVKDLRMRIELRQISVRDRAAALGSIGPCGLMTCCSSFLRNYGHVSIRMAKNQNLALIPSKLNGVCGQIKCCIKYEDDVYSNKRKRLPKEGSFIEAKNGDRGKITKLHVLVEQFEMITDRGEIRRYARNQFDPERKIPKDWQFPTRFDHVTNESKNVIGLTQEKETQGQEFSDDLERSKANLEALNSEDSNFFEEIRDDIGIDGPATARKEVETSEKDERKKDNTDTEAKKRDKRRGRRGGRGGKSRTQGHAGKGRNNREGRGPKKNSPS